MKNLFAVVAVVICCAGQVLAQTPAELRSWLPPVAGWTISENTEVFSPDNLFDRINGAAPLFIENNFQEMTSMEYTKGDDYITIQAYRHGTPQDTFGMYASERSSSLEFFPIGGEAQGDDKNVYFFAGNIYVKMWGSSKEDISGTLKNIARGLANNIDSDAGYPFVLKVFPAEGKKPHSEAYITSSYLGHEFLKHAYTAEYERDGKKFQAFVIDAHTRPEAIETLNKYFTFTRQPLEFQEGPLVIKDRYNGDIPARWLGRYIVGIFAENGLPADADEFIRKLTENFLVN